MYFLCYAEHISYAVTSSVINFNQFSRWLEICFKYLTIKIKEFENTWISLNFTIIL